MAIEILTENEWESMRRAGRIAAATLDVVEHFLNQSFKQSLKPGVSTADIDDLVRRDTALRGGTPSQLGYHGFPASVCTSVNDVVCHGIPSPTEILKDGDIVNVDVTTCVNGFHGDLSRTFLIGKPSVDALHVVDVVRRCLQAGIDAVRCGGRLGDIGHAIAELAHGEGCSVVEDFGGHGIGRQMHLDPHISHVGERGEGTRVVKGMAFTIEPMINLGGKEVRVLDDGWRVVTADGSLSAQFEHTVLISGDRAEVLTRSLPTAKLTS